MVCIIGPLRFRVATTCVCAFSGPFPPRLVPSSTSSPPVGLRVSSYRTVRILPVGSRVSSYRPHTHTHHATT
eukprot:4767180-Prymnesium_polylepis.1